MAQHRGETAGPFWEAFLQLDHAKSSSLLVTVTKRTFAGDQSLLLSIIMCMYIYIYTYTAMYVCIIYIYMYINVYKCIYLNVCMYIYIYVCMYMQCYSLLSDFEALLGISIGHNV